MYHVLFSRNACNEHNAFVTSSGYADSVYGSFKALSKIFNSHTHFAAYGRVILCPKLSLVSDAIASLHFGISLVLQFSLITVWCPACNIHVLLLQ
jgi:hypothetical protein